MVEVPSYCYCVSASILLSSIWCGCDPEVHFVYHPRIILINPGPDFLFVGSLFYCMDETKAYCHPRQPISFGWSIPGCQSGCLDFSFSLSGLVTTNAAIHQDRSVCYPFCYCPAPPIRTNPQSPPLHINLLLYRLSCLPICQTNEWLVGSDGWRLHSFTIHRTRVHRTEQQTPE